ncbi:hypothetical protein SASPL_113726 [Salvia splendens]|uniref:Uncharacterized protein n=1 Tax=Salvia splendens TaxID=180675 RepID=A0A8X8ZYP2_SALSN|nr:hypothetical protein SASPL_113726 [Salvia splendens]
MANRVGHRTEPIGAPSTSVAVGLESQPAPTAALDTPALAFEHILASIARLEARLDASERRAAITQPPPRPDPDPPYSDWQRGRDDTTRHRAVSTTATGVSSQPQLGFGGGTFTRGPLQANHGIAMCAAAWGISADHPQRGIVRRIGRDLRGFFYHT